MDDVYADPPRGGRHPTGAQGGDPRVAPVERRAEPARLPSVWTEDSSRDVQQVRVAPRGGEGGCLPYFFAPRKACHSENEHARAPRALFFRSPLPA